MSKYPNLERVWTAVHHIFGDCLEYNDEIQQPDENTCWKNVELYLVGGCVRDTLLERPVKDYDFCTNLTPEEMKYLLKKAGRRAYTVGEKFGTIGFKIEVDLLCHPYSSENEWVTQDFSEKKWILVECTTYRSEKYEAGNRKPQVEFSTSLDFDLSRRDFTINALAFGKNPVTTNFEIVDKYAGRLDLRKGIIKAVGDSKDRFRDDPLRMLRAIRFANKYNFELENNLRGNISKMKDRILDISIERVVSELDQILLSSTPDYGISLMSSIYPQQSTSLLSVILPEVFDVGVYKRLDHIEVDPLHPEEGLNRRWKTLLSETGTRETKEIEYKDDELTVYKIKQNPKLTNYINRGICARMKFSKERTLTILGK